MFPIAQTFQSEFSSDDYESCSGFTSFASKNRKPSESCTTDDMQTERQSHKKILLTLQTSGDSHINANIKKHVRKFNTGDNPVAIINELNLGCEFKVTSLKSNGPLSEIFMSELTLAGQTFKAQSHSKKSAKLEVAKKALSSVYNLDFSRGKILQKQSDDNIANLQTNCDGMSSDIIHLSHKYKLDHALAEDIGQTIMEANAEIFETLKDNNKWSVLAGIVLTSEEDPKWSDLISLTTGTKCIHGDSMSMFGASLHDCHAEILSRRCFMVYLYEQITQYTIIDRSGLDPSKDNSIIIERCINKPGYRLKPHIKVNLFISTSPCGDARIFSPNEQMADTNSKSTSRGLLRAKIEAGQGTIPVKNDNTLAWDALMQGQQRLRIMSCSDKLALWNVVGLQGSLLSHLLEPIYLDGLIIASLYDFEHTYRAVAGRLNHSFDSQSLKELPKQYRLNVPKMASCSICVSKTRVIVEGKSPSYAINYIKNKPPEIVSTVTGKVMDGTMSRLSKKALFTRFIELLNVQPSLMQESLLIEPDGTHSHPGVYREAKTASKIYQTAKNKVFGALIEQSLGKWLRAPCEVDLFKTC